MKLITLLLLSFPCLAEPFKVGALGDSITFSTLSGSGGFELKGVDKPRLKLSFWDKLLFKVTAWPEYSWATGSSEKVNSICSRFKKMFDSVECKNFSVPGERASGVVKWQLPELLKFDPDVVTIEIGPNDLSNGTDPESFSSSIKQILSGLNGRKRQIIVVAIADVTSIQAVRNETAATFVKCSTMWKWLNINPKFTDPKLADASRDTLRKYNKALKEASALYTNVYYTNKVEMFKFTPDLIGKYDCFHPNIKGQAFLAEAAWPFK